MPMLYEFSPFIQFMLLIGMATVVATICHYLSLPTIVGFIIAGVAAGPSALGLVKSLPNVDLLTEVAAILLMFTIGLEFSFKKLIRLRGEFLRLGLTQVVLTTMVITLACQYLLGFSLDKSIFFGFLVSLSSTALVLKLLQDARDLETPYGRSSLSILLFQDLAVIPMVAALPLLAAGKGLLPTNPLLILKVIGIMAGAVIFIIVASRWLIPLFVEKVLATRSRELFFFAILFVVTGTIWTFHSVGLSMSLGAFAAGMIISESPYGHQVTSDIVPWRDNFLGLFFITVGMQLDLAFLADNGFATLRVWLVIFAVKAVVVMIAGMFNRNPVSAASFTAIILTQIGEFSFIMAKTGQDLGLMSSHENQFFISVSIVSMALTPFLFKLAPKVALSKTLNSWKFLNTSKEAAKVRTVISHAPHEATGHTIIVGYGIAGQNMGAAMKSLGIPFQVIEMNYEAVKSHSRFGVKIHFGDASRVDVLEHAGIENARLVVIAVSGAKIVPGIIAAVRKVRPDIQIIVRAQYVRDAEGIENEATTDIVVAEIETSIELLGRSLKVYGVSPDDIRTYMHKARTQLNNFAQMTTRKALPVLNLPSWDALSSIKPLRIGENYFAGGKALAELALPRQSSCSVVSVYRTGLGTAIPDGEFVLEAGDVIHMIGSPDNLANAERLLKFGPGSSGK